MTHKSQEQSIREELTCAICYELFQDPVMLECMHHFCKECIQRYWDMCSGVVKCPQCRQVFPCQSFRPHYLVTKIVDTVRESASEEHNRKLQDLLKDALKSCQMEQEKLMQMKHVSEESIWSLLKTSDELNSKIRLEFAYLHWILEEEERTTLMELAREDELWLVRLRQNCDHLEEGICKLKKNMEFIQQTLNKLRNSLQVEEETVETSSLFSLLLANGRMEVQVDALPIFNTEKHKDKYEGPLQYTVWKKMLKSINPSPTPLTLDPESAHPNLIISRDLTAVTEGEKLQPVPRSSCRFLQCVNVLAKESFETGRHYWEVWVGNKTKWDLGVAADTVDRIAKVKLCPENGYWTVRLRENSKYWAASTPEVCLKPESLLRKVGILLDCQKEKVTFCNAEDMSHLFTFHQAMAGKFYPFFSTCFSDGNRNAEPMRICHLNL